MAAAIAGHTDDHCLFTLCLPAVLSVAHPAGQEPFPNCLVLILFRPACLRSPAWTLPVSTRLPAVTLFALAASPSPVPAPTPRLHLAASSCCPRPSVQLPAMESFLLRGGTCYPRKNAIRLSWNRRRSVRKMIFPMAHNPTPQTTPLLWRPTSTARLCLGNLICTKSGSLCGCAVAACLSPRVTGALIVVLQERCHGFTASHKHG